MFTRLFTKQTATTYFKLLHYSKFDFSKIIPIKLPDLGEGTKEATIRTWYKKEGETVEEVKIERNKILIKLYRKIKLWKYSQTSWWLIFPPPQKEKYIRFIIQVMSSVWWAKHFVI